MERIISYFIENKLVSAMIIILVVVGGFYIMQNMQRESFPSVSFNTLTITTVYPGAAPEDVELNVTIPVERELAKVAGIDYIRSLSTENLSMITIQADDDLDRSGMSRVLDDVQSALDRVEDLPEDIDGRPRVTELRVEDRPVLEVALSGPIDVLKPLALRLETALRSVPGVATITKVGYFEPEIHVEIDPWRMDKYEISFDEVINSILTRNVRASGGSLDSFIGRKSLVTMSKFETPAEVKRVILRSNFEQRRVLLQDVATVRMREKDERLKVRSNGRDGISLVITKKPSADIITTVDGIKAFMEKQQLPPQVTYDFINDFSKRTRTRISIVLNNSGIGFVLVFLMLILFLNRKTAAWTSFGIPFSILGAFCLLPLFGLNINNITLAGFLVVIGMLVDDAIVVAEHIERLKESGVPAQEAARRGTREMIAPVTAAALTTIAAYLPIFFIGGKPGKFAWAIPIVVTLTLAVSLFESFFILPGHIAHMKGKSKPRPGWLVRLEESYKALLQRVLRRRYLFATGLLLLLLVSVVIARSTMKVVLFPSSGTEEFYVKFEAPVGSSVERTALDVKRVEAIVESIKKRSGEITSYSARVGHMNVGGAAQTSGDHENWAVLAVYLKPIGERSRTAAQIIQEIKQKMKPLSGTRVMFEEKKFGPPMGRPSEIVVLGNNEQAREQVLTNLTAFMKRIKGVRDVERDDKDGKPQLLVRLDYDKLAAYGLTTKDIASLVRIAFDGHKVTSLQTLDQEIFYRVILSPRYRGEADSIKYLKARNRMGQLIRVDQLVRFKTVPSKQDLRHYDGVRAVTVSAEVDTSLTSPIQVAQKVQKKFLAGRKLPGGVRVIIAGEARESSKVLGDVVIAITVALLAVFFLVGLVLKNTLQTLFVVAVIPFTMIGFIWTLLGHGQDISLFTLLGLIGLAGVVVNDSIVMVDRLNKFVAEKAQQVDLSIADEAKTRLRPILLTTITTVAGLLPAGYGLGGADPMVEPLALVVGWGLIFGTIITLFLVPCLYLIQGDLRKHSVPARTRVK